MSGFLERVAKRQEDRSPLSPEERKEVLARKEEQVREKGKFLYQESLVILDEANKRGETETLKRACLTSVLNIVPPTIRLEKSIEGANGTNTVSLTSVPRINYRDPEIVIKLIHEPLDSTKIQPPYIEQFFLGANGYLTGSEGRIRFDEYNQETLIITNGHFIPINDALETIDEVLTLLG